MDGCYKTLLIYCPDSFFPFLISEWPSSSFSVFLMSISCTCKSYLVASPRAIGDTLPIGTQTQSSWEFTSPCYSEALSQKLIVV